MTAAADQIEDPGICIIRIRAGEKIAPKLAGLLHPVDPATFHEYRLGAHTPVELHYHDFDEYWWFTAGRPRVTLRTPGGVTREFELQPGDLVAAVRGVEHTLWADHELVYFQFSSVRQGTEGTEGTEGTVREGHLTRGEQR
ncbi:MAG TPA: hypothetical protein VIL86_03555 [Tepidisphaeraceae bacterium]|jgi:mannose-6-phosphate isomerase-like protein (cupin superfamily)